jgi:1,4-alpha-glucan branching enzyme
MQDHFHTISADDLHYFHEGSHVRLFDCLGAHLSSEQGQPGCRFSVWAPSAETVSVIGDFNGWNPDANRMDRIPDSGVWTTFVNGAQQSQCYKFKIRSQNNGYTVDKADPLAFHCEVAPKTSSVIWPMDYHWNDSEWMKTREQRSAQTAPISIYECHVGSWKRIHEAGFRSLSYRELGPDLAKYCKEMGFTHVELLPVTEHPYFPSWGYQTTGFFAATSRYGTPQDLMYCIDILHQHGIAVILDWVPSHFATDEHALGYFDGTHLYEHANPQQGFHPDWGSFIFNYGRHEVRSFLLSSAIFWLEKYHADGLRVDAVASMLYLDYSRKQGEWIPNQYGGRENIEAIDFLRRMNHEVYTRYPGVQTYAEESTAWPMVSRPAYSGGLGFGYKWDMGWMHDSLKYAQRDPLFRKFEHHLLTFRMLYAYAENYVLPLSHDEVVHGKGPLYDKMAGDHWQKLATLRTLYGAMFGMTGKKLMFMGDEFGQTQEWRHDGELDWHLLGDPAHAGMQKWVKDLNMLYQNEACLHELDNQSSGFEWIDCSDGNSSVVNFLRKGTSSNSVIVVILNYTPVVHHNYRVGLPGPGYWTEVLNSDAAHYGGSNVGNSGGVPAEAIPLHGRAFSANMTVPPLSAVFLKGTL